MNNPTENKMEEKLAFLRFKKFKWAFLILLVVCIGGIAIADSLTPQQVYNLDLENDINNNIWTAKGSWRDIQAMEAMIAQDIATLNAQGIAVPGMNWTDINQAGSVNWSTYGYGN